MSLSNAQKRYLRGLGHHLKPVVTIAEKGLTENVSAEIELALTHHELVKIKLRQAREQRKDCIRQIAENTGAELVHSIGQIACYYRKNPDKAKIALPA